MNAAEKILDRLHPRVGAELRLLKSRRSADPILRMIDVFLGLGETAVDIGARRGLYTMRLARVVGPAGHVHAIEPLPDNAARLRRSQKSNVTVHPFALSDHEAQESFYVPLHDGRPLDALASLTPPSGPHQVTTIEVRRLDDLFGARAEVQFVKCDAEGHEFEVLKGADGLLRRNLPPLQVKIEQRHQTESVQRTFDYLAEVGYAGFYFATDGAHPLAQFDLERDQLRFLTADFYPGVMPRGYINRFFFLPSEGDAEPLLAP